MPGRDHEKRELIASRLRSAREAAGLSQGQAAKKMDLHRPSVSEIEAGRRAVSAEELAAFAEMYGVSVNWLTGGDWGEKESVEDRILIAARELSRMKDEDLDRLLSTLRMLRKPKEKE